MSTFPQDYCVTPQSNGGSGGGAFSFYINGGKGETVLPDGSTVQSYYCISKIVTWVSTHRMQGIQIWLSNSPNGYADNNTNHMFGKASGTMQTYTFQPGELITSLAIYNAKYNGNHYCGGVKFETSLGGNYTNVSGGSNQVMNVGGGVCVGIFGRSGDVVDSLGFWMISVPYDISISNVVYDGSGPPAPARNIIYAEEGITIGLYPSNYTYSSTSTVETQETWSVVKSSETSVSLSVEVSADVYSVTSTLGAQATWTLTQENTKSTSYSESYTYTVNYEETLEQGKVYRFELYDYSGEYSDLDFSAFYKLKLPNNVTFSYCGKGVAAGKSNSETYSSFVEI